MKNILMHKNVFNLYILIFDIDLDFLKNILIIYMHQLILNNLVYDNYVMYLFNFLFFFLKKYFIIYYMMLQLIFFLYHFYFYIITYFIFNLLLYLNN